MSSSNIFLFLGCIIIASCDSNVFKQEKNDNFIEDNVAIESESNALNQTSNSQQQSSADESKSPFKFTITKLNLSIRDKGKYSLNNQPKPNEYYKNHSGSYSNFKTIESPRDYEYYYNWDFVNEHWDNFTYDEFIADLSNGEYPSHIIEVGCTIKVLNQSGTSINTYRAEGDVYTRFNDEEKAQLLFRGRLCRMDPPQLEISEGSESNWLPETVRTFEFTPPEPNLENDFSCDTDKGIFKRTPVEVFFLFKYSFTGVDGEFSDEVKVNLIDEWKRHQKEIGLR